MRRIGFFTLALLALIAVPARGQDPRAVRPSPAAGPAGPATLWVAISTTTARMSGKIALVRRDPKGGPSALAVRLNSSKSNAFRAVALEGGGAGTLDLEVSDEVDGQAQVPGDPIPDIDVSLAKLDGKAISEHRTARTDAAGGFVFDDVPPGDYELRWEIGGLAQAQRVTIMTGAEGRMPGDAACRRKCAAEHTNSQGHLNADAYGACLRECMSGAATCPVPDDGAAHREPCPEDRPACPTGEDITCVRGRWVCIGAAEPSR
jgi:hypothetical protein